MANYKRHKPKTYDYPTCPWGIRCEPVRVYSDNSKRRRTHKDYQQPQLYDEAGRNIWQAIPGFMRY